MNNLKEKNVGLSVLRIVLSYSVICIHFWDAKSSNFLADVVIYLKTYAVPTFMLMSFALCGKMFEENENDRIKKRFVRLIIPQVAWTIIYFVLYLLMDVFFGKNKISGFEDFWWQLLTGSRQGINQTMWYQIALIWMTALFVCIFKMLKEKSYILLIILSVIVLCLEYSGALEFIYSWRYEFASLTGRFIEYIPIATIGYCVTKFGIIDKIKGYPFAWMIFMVLTVGTAKFKIFPTNPNSNYSGIPLIISSLIIFLLFYSMPVLGLSGGVTKFVNEIGSYSLGVYCMHRLVETILRGICEVIRINVTFSSLGGCLFIYLICILISACFVKLFKQKYIRMLFI